MWLRVGNSMGAMRDYFSEACALSWLKHVLLFGREIILCIWQQKNLYDRSVQLNNGRRILRGIVAKADTLTLNKRIYPKVSERNDWFASEKGQQIEHLMDSLFGILGHTQEGGRFLSKPHSKRDKCWWAGSSWLPFSLFSAPHALEHKPQSVEAQMEGLWFDWDNWAIAHSMWCIALGTVLSWVCHWCIIARMVFSPQGQKNATLHCPRWF